MTPAKKLRVYLETTVWNFPFHDDAPERQSITQQFFEQVREGRYEVYSSGIVYNELKAASDPRRSQLVGLFDEISPTLLRANDEALELSRRYLEGGMTPDKFRNDAVHIAIAVVNNIDVLLSWNFKHIVKVKTRRIVSATSRLVGYRDIDICTPEEVIYDDR